MEKPRDRVVSVNGDPEGMTAGDETLPLLANQRHGATSSVTEEPPDKKLGTFFGVFIPCVLSIFGVILFLRLG